MKRLTLHILFALLYVAPVYAEDEFSFFNSGLRSEYIASLVFYKVSPTKKYDPVDDFIEEVRAELNINIYSRNIESGLLSFEMDVLEWLTEENKVSERRMSEFWKLNVREISIVKEYYFSKKSITKLNNRMKMELQNTRQKNNKTDGKASFKEHRDYARGHSELNGVNAWSKAYKEGRLPKNLYFAPWEAFSDHPDWVDTYDLFGTEENRQVRNDKASNEVENISDSNVEKASKRRAKAKGKKTEKRGRRK